MICEEWYLPKQTVFNICKEYREKGWIEFFESPNDKRECIMRLTEASKQQAEQFIGRPSHYLNGSLKHSGNKK